jgi:hypothetical protein
MANVELDDYDDPDYYDALLEQLYEEEFGGSNVHNVYHLLDNPAFLRGLLPWPQFVDV